MSLLLERRMAKGKGGRPRKEDGDSSTRQIRVFADLADMMADIIDVEGGSVANLVDGWLRPHVTAKHKALKELIDQMRKLREKAQQPEQKPKRG